MKKNIVLTLFAAVIAVLCVCGIAGAQGPDHPLYPGNSELYSIEDIKSAADVIMAEFSTWEGCEMYRLEYAGDAHSLYELETVNAYSEEHYDECMVFLSAFRSPDEVTGAWTANEDYCWSWMVVRVKGGEWTLNNWGWAEYYQESDQYSVYDMDGGSENIRADIEQMEGVKLLNISYTNDKLSAENLEYINRITSTVWNGVNSMNVRSLKSGSCPRKKLMGPGKRISFTSGHGIWAGLIKAIGKPSRTVSDKIKMINKENRRFLRRISLPVSALMRLWNREAQKPDGAYSRSVHPGSS